MIQQGRCALLLRPQIARTLTDSQCEHARQILASVMARVESGPTHVIGRDWNADPRGDEATVTRTVAVEAYLLDRFPVTNGEFRQFVDAGGYDQLSLWDESIRAAVREFVDSTGSAGPRFWQHGTFAEGQQDLPVTGVCWYEASAFARWCGKRLPTDAEWIKAASWPMPVGQQLAPRRFPWGETYDKQRANLWEAGIGKLVPVAEFAAGDNPAGVRQLVGNVWEWTSSGFAGFDKHAEFETPVVLKSLRGGAFDSYFPHQACWRFQSGDQAVARRHNVGFRCAISVCDVWDGEPPAAAPQPNAQSEEREEPA
jgi:gamma-glutamyl hercynylcysteine S-oxide synthase